MCREKIIEKDGADMLCDENMNAKKLNAKKLVEEIITTIYLHLCLSMGVTLETSWILDIRNNKI